MASSNTSGCAVRIPPPAPMIQKAVIVDSTSAYDVERLNKFFDDGYEVVSVTASIPQVKDVFGNSSKWLVILKR